MIGADRDPSENRFFVVNLDGYIYPNAEYPAYRDSVRMSMMIDACQQESAQNVHRALRTAHEQFCTDAS
jgi:hypothetical protein